MFIKNKNYTAKVSYLKQYLSLFWFIPSDVLQRAIEANIWSLCTFKAPVLEIGIGNGEISEFLFKQHPQVAVGIDIEKEGLERAQKGGKYKKVLCVNAEKMPFKDESFNTVISNSTFEHINKDLKGVSEVARVLRKDGLFFLTAPSNYLKEWILEYEKEKDPMQAKNKLKKFNKRAYHLHYRSLSEREQNFKKNNLEIIFYQYYFPKEVALFWYTLFTIFTITIRGRELWSYLGQSKITKYLPKKILINLLQNYLLKEKYKKAFFTNSVPGGQLFIVAKKVNG